METVTILGIVGVVCGVVGMIVAIIFRRKNSRIQTKTMNIILKMDQFMDLGFKTTKESLTQVSDSGQQVKVEKVYRDLSNELELLVKDTEKLKKRTGI